MIPFTKTTLAQEEKDAVAAVIDSGWVVLGPKSQEFEEKFAEYVGAKYAVFVDSGTSALFLGCQLLKEKFFNHLTTTFSVPSLTFAATAEAAIHTGYEVSFVDVDEHSFCADATINVHLLGNRSPYKAWIYDSAHRIEKNDVKDSPSIWCYSFYATKNMTTIQGGMICTNDKNHCDWLKQARDHGLNMGTKERYQGAYKQYDVEFVGWRVKGDDLRAVVGLEQLKKLPWATERRNEIVQTYNKGFGLSRAGNHVYPVMVKNQAEFVNYMYEEGIQCTVHFRPLHLMTAYKDYAREDMKNTEYIGSHIVSIPLFPQMTEDEIQYIIKTAHASNMLL